MRAQKLEYLYIRTENDDKFTLFLKIDKSLLEKDIDFNLKDDKTLHLTLDNGGEFVTDTLSDDIYDSLSNLETLIIFTDQNGEIIAKHKMQPMKPFKNKRLKP